MAERIYLAANNPDLGGGEEMVVRTAAVLVSLGRDVTVVAPDVPADVLDAASSVGADVVAIRADGRRDHVNRLRAWDRHERRGLLWCHGLVPALATTAHRHRVVHLHQLPRSRAQWAALRVARAGSTRLLVPSEFLAALVPGAQAFANWTDDVARQDRPVRDLRVGFLGRLSTDKGLDLLADALASRRVDPASRLVAAGDDRWVPDDQRVVVSQALRLLGSRADLVGRIPPAELFAGVDLAVFPSRVAESFGLVVVEAMASGVPFVISDAGALPEVAGPDHPWVARAGDADDLARVIDLALTAPDDVVRAVTDRARRRWEAEYSPQAGRLRVRRLLEELAP
ncbi:glycosyltransferase family 4 protein [Nocardioides sp.]|uniref:glycosyltransferase family 4 protein n=1 Tax=Nocardioides sp. TaxID=35761 RepID=UPI0035B4DB5A